MLASKGFSGHPTYVGDGVLLNGLVGWFELHDHAGLRFTKDTPTNKLVVEDRKVERIGFSVFDGDRKDSYVLARVEGRGFMVWPVSGSKCLSQQDESMLIWSVFSAQWNSRDRSVPPVLIHGLREVPIT